MLKRAYWMEIESVMSYVANSVNPDGVRAQEIIESLRDDIQEELGHALGTLTRDLREAPFAAPDAGRLRELGLDPAALGSLARSGHVLRVGDTVLLPGADDRAVDLLADLPQPFTTSQAREALGTTRRVALPLLAHLDRTGRTVRLPDDRRRVRTG
jgi:selenocysteine-specific elongation factor